MRFSANGPSIPDELLVARDEGRVILFCGAGVSRARAGLADFFGLAKQVLDALEANVDTPTRRLFDAAKRVEAETGISGLVPADRIFGLLEREFENRDIQAAVAKALLPPVAVDLSAHQTLLELSTGPDGKARLITTNFDLLFEAADPNLKSFVPPHLPDPRRHEDLAGVTHLHGRVADGYIGAAEDGFVLSSSEFGHAYISDGWATRFISALLEKYVVVFVGYTADDPPVQYLLEALNRNAGSKGSLYAFQAGTSSDANSRWQHKGVQPIAYDPGENHILLWGALTEWATRARNPDSWHQSIITMACRGPEALLPHERGQVVHLMETVEGARRFAVAADTPPSDWLCVFDPSVRFSTPKRQADIVNGPIVDPFTLYGLDSDPRPASIDANDIRQQRKVPGSVKNPLSLMRLDQQDLGPNGVPALAGHWAANVPLLPDRLRHLGTWITKVAHQPAAVWWAAGKQGLHPAVQQMIRLHLWRAENPSSRDVRRAWRVLCEAWDTRPDDAHTPWFELKASIALDGWSSAAARELARTQRAHLTVERPWIGSPKPPPLENSTFDDMLLVGVDYPEIDMDIEIPDSMIHSVIREFRRNVEHAVALETETGGYKLSQFAPIEADPDLEATSSQRDFGISRCVLLYAGLYKRLVVLDPAAARQEYDSWHREDDDVFARLRVWASTQNGILTDVEAGSLFIGLPDSAFWGGAHQRDLLLALQKRWGSLPDESATEIERRLLAGPPVADRDPPDDMQQRAWFSLNRLYWLHNHGCQFSFDFDTESARLRDLVPNWQPANAERAARSFESQSGYVRTDSNFDALLSVPLAELLIRAKELSGHNLEGFVRDDPFSGLATARPIRAFRALINAAKQEEWPHWAWTTFLARDARANDKPRLSCAIAWRISSFPAGTVGELAYQISAWLETASPSLAARCPPALDAIWTTLIAALGNAAAAGRSTIVRRKDERPDWVTEALNSPVGKLTQVLMHDARVTAPKPNSDVSASWLHSVEQLLSLPEPARQHALAILAHNLNWFDARAPQWTEQHFIASLDDDGPDRDAIWAGYFWRNCTPAKSLYRKLKDNMISLIESHSVTEHDHVGFLAAMLLDGWQRIDVDDAPQLITDSEMRDMLLKGGDDLRAQALWYLGRWIKGDDPRGQAWARLLPEFLRDVWPRHKAAKTPKTSARLCDLAFSDVDIFSRISDVVTDLETQVSHQHLVLTNLQDEGSTIVSRYPKKALTLLSSVLPEAVARWPYGLEGILDRLQHADPSLARNEKMIELRRKLAAG